MKAPIGVIDSGVGGLTVVREMIERLPKESIIYIGDDARCPYGPKSPEEVASYTVELAEALQHLGIKMLVIACNTATAAALPIVSEAFDFPIIGVIEPGSRAALQVSKNEKIVVLGTIGTVKSEAYNRAILRRSDGRAEVQALACPNFVPIVEAGEYDTPQAKEVVAETLSVLDSDTFDTAILGCTHYPLLEKQIRDYFPPSVEIISSAVETVKDVERTLRAFGIQNKESGRTIRFYTTGERSEFKEIVEDWLPIERPVVEHINLQAVIRSKGRTLR